MCVLGLRGGCTLASGWVSPVGATASSPALVRHLTHHRPVCLRCLLLLLLAFIPLQAALCCEPLPAAEREALAQGLQGLPLKQLEAALGLVLPRMAPGLLAGGVAAAAAANGSNGSTEVRGVCWSGGWCGWGQAGGLGVRPGPGGTVGYCLVSLPKSFMLSASVHVGHVWFWASGV